MSSAPRLLLIDQDPADRSRAAAALMALFPVTRLREVELGADFFEALKDSSFDVVITEMATEWASWPFLLGAIRALQPAATIVVYTRETDEASRRDVLAAGAAACVVKSERGLLDLTQAVDRLLSPPAPSETPELRDRPRTDGSSAAEGPVVHQPQPPQTASASPPPTEPRQRPPAQARKPDIAGHPRHTMATWIHGLRDREAGGALAILAVVIALTAALTALLAGSGGNEAGPEAGERTPHGIVAGEMVATAQEPTPTEQMPAAKPGREVATATPPPSSRPPARRPLASDAPVAIELRPRDEVWVRLYLDGEKVLETTLQPGQNRFYEADEIADLTIGDAAALTVFWNGTDLGSLGAVGQVRRINLSPTRVGTGAARPAR